MSGHPSPGQRVTRRFDGAAGTVETVTPWDSETGDWAIAVRLDKDGEVWSGTEAAWEAQQFRDLNGEAE
jgi:hypothetical protein